MKRIKLKLDRSVCIDCASCIPEAYNPITNKEYIADVPSKGVHICDVPFLEEGVEEIVLEVNEDQLKNLMNAVKVCPVEAISIEELN